MVECLLDVEKVSGSSPLSSTNKTKATNSGCFFVLLPDDNRQRTLSQSERGAQVFASHSLRSNYSSRCSHYSQNKFGILLSKNLAKVNAMRSSIFHQLPPLRVANLITYFTLCETFFRGPLSSTRSIKVTSRLDLNCFL